MTAATSRWRRLYATGEVSKREAKLLAYPRRLRRKLNEPMPAPTALYRRLGVAKRKERDARA